MYKLQTTIDSPAPAVTATPSILRAVSGTYLDVFLLTGFINTPSIRYRSPEPLSPMSGMSLFLSYTLFTILIWHWIPFWHNLKWCTLVSEKNMNILKINLKFYLNKNGIGHHELQESLVKVCRYELYYFNLSLSYLFLLLYNIYSIHPVSLYI